MKRPTNNSAMDEMPMAIGTEVAPAGVTTPVPNSPSGGGHHDESDLLTVLAMRAKRVVLTGAIAQRTEEIERLSKSLNHLDEARRLFEAADLGNGPAPDWCRRSAKRYLTHAEMRRRSLNAMQGGAIITAREIVDALMPEKGLDPVKDKELRSSSTKRSS